MKKSRLIAIMVAVLAISTVCAMSVANAAQNVNGQTKHIHKATIDDGYETFTALEVCPQDPYAVDGVEQVEVASDPSCEDPGGGGSTCTNGTVSNRWLCDGCYIIDCSTGPCKYSPSRKGTRIESRCQNGQWQQYWYDAPCGNCWG